MALTLWGKPGPIPYATGIAQSYAKLAHGRGLAFEHAKSFTVVAKPNSDRGFTMGGTPPGGLPAGYATANELNRVGYDGLLITQDTVDEGQLDMAATSPRWDIVAIQTAAADTSTGTATMVVLKGTEGNAAGAVTIPGESLGVKTILVQDVCATPGQAAITPGGRYLVFAGRAMQVLDKTPPQINTMPAGSAFMDPSSTSMKLRVTDAAGNVTTRGTSDVRLNGKSKAVTDLLATFASAPETFTQVGEVSFPLFLLTEHGGTAATRTAGVAKMSNGKAYVITQGYNTNAYQPRTIGVVDFTRGTWTTKGTLITSSGGGDHHSMCVNASETKVLIYPISQPGYLYSLTTNTSQSIAMPGSISRNGNYFAVGDDFYVIAGLNSSGSGVAECWKLANGSTTWSSLAACPTPSISVIHTDGTYFYVNYSGNTVYVYTIASNTWTTLNSYTGSMSGLSASWITMSPDNNGIILWDTAGNAHRLVGTSATTTLYRNATSTTLRTWLDQYGNEIRSIYTGTAFTYTHRNGVTYRVDTTKTAGQVLKAGFNSANTPLSAVLSTTAISGALVESTYPNTVLRNRTRSADWLPRVSAQAGDVIDYFTPPGLTSIDPQIIEMGGI